MSIRTFLATMLFFSAPIYALDANNHFYIVMLLNKDPLVSRLGAQSIFNNTIPDVAVVDTVAELLLTKAPQAKDPVEVDAVAWYARVIADKNNGRYDEIIAFVRSQSVNKKILSYLEKDAQHPLKIDNSDKYVKGLISLESLPEFHQNSDAKPQLAIGSPLTYVYQNYGAPPSVKAERKNYEIGFEKRALLALTYSNDIRFVIAFSPTNSPQWSVRQIEQAEQADTSGYVYSGPIENEYHGYLTLLASSNPIESKLGTRSLYQDNIIETTIMDIVAEQLYNNISNDKAGHFVDTIAWYAKTLGATQNGRYREVLTWAQSHYANPKIRKYVTEALTKLSKDAEPYKQGEVSLTALRESLKTYGDLHVLESENRDFKKIRTGLSLKQVYQLLGTPDAIEDLTVHGGWGMYRGDALMLILHYYDYGVIQFIYDESPNKGWVLKHPMPAAVLLQSTYDGEDRKLANTLLSARGSGLWMTMRPVLDSIQNDRKMLSVLSKRLIASGTTKDDWEVKALAHAARLIGRSKDQSFLPELEAAEKATKDSDLHGYVVDAIKLLNKS